jgi:hypothetical protein
MTTFRAPKGPEDMLLVAGQRFYNLYGSQDKIKFNTYKQPLLQASMDINEGARLIAKRAVLDSAKLANATVGIMLSKQLDVRFTKNEDGYIKDATFGDTKKYVLRPVIVSIKDNTDTSSNSAIVEGKFMYNTHKDKISYDIAMGESLKMNTGLVGVYTNGTTTENIPLDNGTWTNNDYTAGVIANGNSSEVVYTNPTGTGTVTADYSEATTDEQKTLVQTKFLSTVYAAANGGEYFFPLFTIFDNGRGVSLKNYAIVFDRVCICEKFRLFQARHRPHERLLNIFGQTAAQTVRIYDISSRIFRLKNNMMAVHPLESYYFILYGGAVSNANTCYRPTI